MWTIVYTILYFQSPWSYCLFYISFRPVFRLLWGRFLTFFALYCTAPCPVCRTEGLHHVDSQRCHWSLPHVMRGPWLLSQQRPAGLVRQLHPYMHLRGREHSHDAADCTVTCHTEIWPHCDTSKGHFGFALNCNTWTYRNLLFTRFSTWNPPFCHTCKWQRPNTFSHAPTHQPYRASITGTTPALLPQQNQTHISHIHIPQWQLCWYFVSLVEVRSGLKNPARPSPSPTN